MLAVIPAPYVYPYFLTCLLPVQKTRLVGALNDPNGNTQDRTVCVQHLRTILSAYIGGVMFVPLLLSSVAAGFIATSVMVFFLYLPFVFDKGSRSNQCFTGRF